jgi:hypothetical protein
MKTHEDVFAAPVATVKLRQTICRRWDLRFQAQSGEIATCHSSPGGEFGERIGPVKDAKHRLRQREP